MALVFIKLGKRIGTTYSAKPRIVPEAFIQSAAYITELLAEEKDFKLGYLAVFDAREEELPDTGTDMTIDQNTRKKIERLIIDILKLADFRVINEHPN